MKSFLPLLLALLCSCPLSAMENNNNNNNNYAPSAPPAYGSEDDLLYNAQLAKISPTHELTGLEHLADAVEHPVMQIDEQSSPQRFTYAQMMEHAKRDKIIMHLSLKNNKGSEFCARSMSYDIQDNGSCTPTLGWSVIANEDQSDNPAPAFGWHIGSEGLREWTQQINATMAVVKRMKYEPCFIPLKVSLTEKTALILFSLSRVSDNERTLVMKKTKLTIPICLPNTESYTKTIEIPDAAACTLEITTGIGSSPLKSTLTKSQ